MITRLLRICKLSALGSAIYISEPIFFFAVFSTHIMAACAIGAHDDLLKGGKDMISTLLSTLGVFLGIMLIILVVGLGFISGAFKLLKVILSPIVGLFRKKN